MTKESQFGNHNTEDNKRKALDALDLRGNRHDAAAAADVSLKTLDDWRRGNAEFAAEWDVTIERVMKRLREQPLDDKGNFKRSPLQYGLKATGENKEIVLAMLANGATYGAAAAAVGAHRRTIMKWADADEEFAQRWNDAIEEGIDRLEQEAIRRARRGEATCLLHGAGRRLRSGIQRQPAQVLAGGKAASGLSGTKHQRDAAGRR